MRWAAGMVMEASTRKKFDAELYIRQNRGV
jgi:hypothetical protein